MDSIRFKLELVAFCTCMFFYVIWRFFVIFHNNSKIIPLIIAVILSCYVVFTFMYWWNNKILDILSTISSRIFVLWFLLMVLLSIEHLISIWYKINPRIIVWIIVLILWLWTYFSLHTKITYLNIETNKVHKDTKILLVSDIHAEHVTSTFHINKIRKMIETEKPDFTIIAWDLINKPNDWYAQYFENIEPDYQPTYHYPYYDTLIFAVMGNHDVMWNTEAIKKVESTSRITFLNNETITFLDWVTSRDWCKADEANNCTWTIQIIWLVDKSLRWNKNVDQILKEAMYPESPILGKIAEYNPNTFKILVTHQPIWLERLKDYPIDLEVAWHTHRGQFFWMRKVVQLMNDYAYWEYKLWDRMAFVSQWIWTWWLPFRLWTQSEMVIINLKKK